jgi:hypothetical protein
MTLHSRLTKTSAMVLVACGVLVPLSVKALPFEKTPEDFLRFANSLAYGGQSGKYFFFNPRDCRDIDADWVMNCEVDYKENSSLGTRTCIGSDIYWNNNLKQVRFLSKPDECGSWEKVSATPEPQEPSTPPSPPVTPTPPTPPAATPAIQSGEYALRVDEILIGGAVLFLLGGGLALLLTKATGQKK